MSEPLDKQRRSIGWAVLGGFVLGAASVLLMVWLYGDGSPPVEAPPPATQGEARPPAQTTPDTAPPVTTLPPPAPPPSPGTGVDLAQRQLLIPVQGIRDDQLQNTFDDSRSEGRVHEAIDIIAPRNTPVLAVEDGRVAKLFQSRLGGLTIYQFDPSETYAYYYAHLERYAPGLKEGDRVRRGQVVGYVGTSGNAGPDNPHLHFAIFRLGPEKDWWKGTPVNPYSVLKGP